MLRNFRDGDMNRKDKIQKIHDKRLKRARKKLKTTSKPPYICKADRAKAEAEASAADSDT